MKNKEFLLFLTFHYDFLEIISEVWILVIVIMTRQVVSWTPTMLVDSHQPVEVNFHRLFPVSCRETFLGRSQKSVPSSSAYVTHSIWLYTAFPCNIHVHVTSGWSQRVGFWPLEDNAIKFASLFPQSLVILFVSCVFEVGEEKMDQQIVFISPPIFYYPIRGQWNEYCKFSIFEKVYEVALWIHRKKIICSVWYGNLFCCNFVLKSPFGKGEILKNSSYQ